MPEQKYMVDPNFIRRDENMIGEYTRILHFGIEPKVAEGELLDLSAGYEMLTILKDAHGKMILTRDGASGTNKELLRVREEFMRSKTAPLLQRAYTSLLKCEPRKAEEYYQFWKSVLCLDAYYRFDSYMLYVELDRPPEKRFYAPRRHYLAPMVRGFQDVLEGKLRLLTISMPKRAGKSQTGINFVDMISGRKPNNSTLMEGTGDDLVKSFYTGCLEYLIQPNDYLFYDVFPDLKLSQTNADTKIFNLDKKSRFPTVMCRSIDARQVGLSEATNLLYMDDCVEGREEAKNRQRLDDKWEIISGDIMGRAIEGTPMVFTGTRYSLYDPIGRIQEYAEQRKWAWRAIEIPALDPVTDESNYEYVREGEKVFTTQYFRDQRELLSQEQFESEFQQQPFEARGLLFPKNDLNYFFELPSDKDPDAVVAVADTAERGSDYTSMPIAEIYGNEIYVVDALYDDAPPEVTKPECAKLLMDYKVNTAQFESNNAGSYYARDVADICKKRGFNISIRTKRTISNKMTRIEMASDGIKKRFWFRHPSTVARGSQYFRFMQALTTYVRTGKVPHDDAPDSLAMLENFLRTNIGGNYEIMDRLW